MIPWLLQLQLPILVLPLRQLLNLEIFLSIDSAVSTTHKRSTMLIRTLNNPSPLIPSVPVLDGNSVTFAAWRSRLLDVLAIMNVLDIVDKSLLCPSDTKDSKTTG
jgi:hypothetical protein